MNTEQLEKQGKTKQTLKSCKKCLSILEFLIKSQV